MTREEYEKQRIAGGYGEPREISYQPNASSDMHTHEKECFVYVLEGEFMLKTESSVERYTTATTCVLPENTPHAELAGEPGARILVAQR